MVAMSDSLGRSQNLVVSLKHFQIFPGDLGFPNFATWAIFLVALSCSGDFVDCLLSKMGFRLKLWVPKFLVFQEKVYHY